MPTPRFGLPFIVQGQAQKEVTHNDALVRLDALIDLYILDRDLTAPPGSPTDGDAYIVAANPTGAWAGQAGNIAYVIDGGWRFHVPVKGMVAYVADEQKMIVFIASGWVDLVSLLALQNISKLGILTAADTTNRLAVKSDAILFSHDDVTPGTGDLRVTLNKSAAAKDSGFVFQDGFGTRALFGLLGDDDFTVKVTPDGSSFFTGVSIDKDDGTAKFPAGLRDPNSGLLATLMVPAIVKDLWRINVTSVATPRTYTISSVSGSAITLTTNQAAEIFSPDMRNLSMVRIWNTSKVPAESAWVNWDNASNQISVANAADIATWANGESIRLGDPNPTGTNVLSMIALDISNYLFNHYGVVWRQRGVLLSNSVIGVGGPANIAYSGDGSTGTALGSLSNSDGSVQKTMQSIFTPQQSPISNSNLLFIKEAISGAATGLGSFRLGRIVGLYV